MRFSQIFLPTVKEDPADADIVSHRLMIRAGLMRRLASGTYNYLPLGLRCLQKVINIVREEMNRTVHSGDCRPDNSARRIVAKKRP